MASPRLIFQGHSSKVIDNLSGTVENDPKQVNTNFTFHMNFERISQSPITSSNKYILLTKREGRTGRISARGLDSTDRAQRGPYKKD